VNTLGFALLLLVLSFLGTATDRSDDVKNETVVSLYLFVDDTGGGVGGKLIKVPFILGTRTSLGGQNIFHDKMGKQKQTLSVE
jgi:hypothetical protein